MLVAAGLCIACGAPAEDVFDVLPMLSTVRGRMQLAATRNNGAAVFVDYAHTPDAVATACQALRPHVMGRLIAIIGAGGDRDTTKRPLMGRAAEVGADRVVLTSDNPRSEDPHRILQQIRAGMDGPALVEADRAVAIERALTAARAGDVVLIAGKGHEATQTIGGDARSFHDPTVAARILAAQERG